MSDRDFGESTTVGATTDRYGVVGHPIAHSRSPEIHAAFARQTGSALEFHRILAPLDGFATTVHRFFDDGGRGLSVTVPFKLEAAALCGARLTDRARLAGAVNCIVRDPDGFFGDNTDGAGLVADLERLLGGAADSLRGSRLLLIGAGGAARGVLGPLIDRRPRAIVVANRDPAKAVALVATRAHGATAVDACSLDAVGTEAFDVVVNATSASLAGEVPAIGANVWRDARLVYDMMYGAAPTAFVAAARRAGARDVADGLGMLVEQAAEAFFVWRGVRPRTAPVRTSLRSMLDAAAS